MIHVDINKKLSSPSFEELNLELDIPIGKISLIKGDSGAGKTSLLHLIGGLVQPDKGVISCDGSDWFHGKKKVYLSVEKRNCGILFQDYPLFPNMTLGQNIDFVKAKSMTEEYIQELLQNFGLKLFLDKRTNELSGGQRQRGALVQLLSFNPSFILLDEPFSAQDETCCKSMVMALQRHQERFQNTLVIASHLNTDLDKLAQANFTLEKGTVLR